MTVSNALINSLLADYKTPEDLIGEHGLLKQLTKRLEERALEAEMAEHLGHGKHERWPTPPATPATAEARWVIPPKNSSTQKWNFLVTSTKEIPHVNIPLQRQSDHQHS